MSYYLLFSKINYSFFITFNLSHYSYVFGEFDSLVEVSCLDCYVNIHANFLPLEMSECLYNGGFLIIWLSIFLGNMVKHIFREVNRITNALARWEGPKIRILLYFPFFQLLFQGFVYWIIRQKLVLTFVSLP